MLTNCPLGKKETHACWLCPFSTAIHNDEGEIEKYMCLHSEYKQKYKVTPRKVTYGFCQYCKEYVRFHLDWMGYAWPTDKGVVTYRGLEARCPHCLREIYVPAVNDVNVYRRNKAYAEKVPEQIAMPIASDEMAKTIEKMLQMQPSEETERGKEILKEMFEGKEK